MIPEKELIDRIEALEKRLKEIDIILEELEYRRAKTITNWLDGPIMMYGKHNIKDEDLNKRGAK